MIYISCMEHTTNLFSTENIISIVDIIITFIFGIYVAVVFTSRFTGNRSVKDFLINENNEIRDEYNAVIKKMYNSEIGASELQKWFKFISIRIENFENLLNPSCGRSLLEIHNSFKKNITLHSSFNEQYEKTHVNFTSNEKLDILRFHKQFSRASLEKIVLINKKKIRKYKNN